MAHFASSTLPASFGAGAQLHSLLNSSIYGTATATAASTSTGVTEGTNLLTYTVAATGLYKCISYLRVAVTSTAAGAHTLNTFIAHNNGSAVTTVAMVGTALSWVGAVGTYLMQEQTVYAVAGTTIAMNIIEIRAAAAVPTDATHKFDLHYSIIALG